MLSYYPKMPNDDSQNDVKRSPFDEKGKIVSVFERFSGSLEKHRLQKCSKSFQDTFLLFSFNSYSVLRTYHCGQMARLLAQYYFLKNGPTPASFYLFSSFSQNNDKFSIQFEIKLNKRRFCAGIRTQGRRMKGW